MTGHGKFVKRLMSGRSDADIKFDDLCTLLKLLGFTMRVRADHHIFSKDGIVEIINLQPVNAKVKPYQVKQVRNLIRAYLIDEDHE
jgi:hypothetical protein